MSETLAYLDPQVVHIRAPAEDRRVPPSSTGAEGDILSAILLDPAALDRVDLDVGDFHDPKHRYVFEAMKVLQAASKPIDLRLLEVELERVGKLAAIGGLAFLSELTSLNPTSDNIEHYVTTVRDKATARALIVTCSEIAAKGFTDYGEAHEYVAEARRAIEGVEARMPIATSKSARRMMEEFARQRIEGLPLVERIPTGYHELDAYLRGGVPVGVVTVVGARPGVGKSSLARGFMLGALRSGSGGHWFAQEDTLAFLRLCFVADISGISAEVIEHGGTREQELAIVAAQEAFAAMPFIGDDQQTLTASQIRGRVGRTAKENGTKLVVVDYFQIMGAPGTRGSSRTERLGAALKGLVALAKDGYAVLVLVQVDRSVEKENRAPQMFDIRECGDVEQDARLVLFIHRERLEQGGKVGVELSNDAAICCAKYTHGRAHWQIGLRFVPEIASYRDRWKK